jgi:outer membrane protein
MSENEISTSTSTGSRSKLPLVIGGLVLLVGLAVGTWVVTKPGLLGSPAKKVGALDQEIIYSLDEFKGAQKQLEAFQAQKKTEFEAAVKARQGKQGGDAELATLYRKIQLEIQQKRNQLFQPLQTKAEAAVATAARSKGLTVVLDKRIVVYGIPDITEDVKKLFQQKGELNLPPAQDTSRSPVAYFDQDVVRSLKIFQEADLLLLQRRNDLMREYESKAASLSPAEQEGLKNRLMADLEVYKEQTMAPLVQKVTASVNEVAKAE